MPIPLHHGGDAYPPLAGEGALAPNVDLAMLTADLRAWRTRLRAFQANATDVIDRAAALRRHPEWTETAAYLYSTDPALDHAADDWPPGDPRHDVSATCVDLIHRTRVLDATREALARELSDLRVRVYGFIIRSTLPTVPTGLAESLELFAMSQAFNRRPRPRRSGARRLSRRPDRVVHKRLMLYRFNLMRSAKPKRAIWTGATIA